MTGSSIIDAHTHVTAAAGSGVPRSSRFPSAPTFTAPVEQLLEAMDATGVAQAVLIQPSLYGFDHSQLLRCLEAQPDRFVGIALADPVDPRFVDRLRELVQRAPIRGFRLAPLIAPDLSWFDAAAEPLYKAAASLELSANLLIPPAVLPVVDRWVAAHPDLTIVIDHLARPDLDPQRPGTVSDDLLRLARFDNVHIKLSALPEMSTRAYPHEDVWPWVRTVLAEFGARRLMWGSDFPYTTDVNGYAQARTVLDACELGSADRIQILSGTAAAIYRLPALTEGSKP
ncbi:amidohydrolase family protein [Sphaerisporangium perillae]|uniref:amidohydrolase family protein n=1 Tax=Sphaerisporangium perillae TaxID=2935860 RepID=UPI00200C4F85|nr:amidohydrolase family protein [Sphaerisporangium perillae]